MELDATGLEVLSNAWEQGPWHDVEGVDKPLVLQGAVVVENMPGPRVDRLDTTEGDSKSEVTNVMRAFGADPGSEELELCYAGSLHRNAVCECVTQMQELKQAQGLSDGPICPKCKQTPEDLQSLGRGLRLSARDHFYPRNRALKPKQKEEKIQLNNTWPGPRPQSNLPKKV